jgi:nitrous oxide reductase accessory protein NosL
MNAPEFVPFSSEEAARDFARLHGGAVRSFDQIESVTAPAASTAAPSEEIDISSRLKALHLHNGTN